MGNYADDWGYPGERSLASENPAASGRFSSAASTRSRYHLVLFGLSADAGSAGDFQSKLQPIPVVLLIIELRFRVLGYRTQRLLHGIADRAVLAHPALAQASAVFLLPG